jgi:hypothetical protein
MDVKQGHPMNARETYDDAEAAYAELCEQNRRDEFLHWTNKVLPLLAQLLALDPQALREDGPPTLGDKPWNRDT